MSDPMPASSAGSDWRELLTPRERACLLDDIGRVALAVGRQRFPERPWDDLDIAGGSFARSHSPAERIGFLAHHLPALVRTVYRICSEPTVTSITRERFISPPVRVRRIRLQAVLDAARRGEAGRVLREQASALSADTPENRMVARFLLTLRRDALVLARMAEAAGESELAATAQGSTREITRLLGAPLFEDLPDRPAAETGAPTHRMLSHEAYAQVYAWMRRYRQAFRFDWDCPLFLLPPRETWQLYETWGLFRVLDALLHLGYRLPCTPPSGEPGCPWVLRDDRLLCTVAHGAPSRLGLISPRGGRLTLWYNRAYPEHVSSLSRTMQPDIALEREPDGRTWLLDPKFKTYDLAGAEADDIAQMHAYRDAIVAPGGCKPVVRAWCLYAGKTGGFNRPWIAYGQPEESVVGALCLRPADPAGFDRLCDLLTSWGLADEPPKETGYTFRDRSTNSHG